MYDILLYLIFGLGVYFLANAFQMKASGKIPKFLINNKINLERSHDIPGYIKYMFPHCLVFGFAICIFSAILIVDGFYAINWIVKIVCELGYFGVIIYYCSVTVKAQNKYLF